MPDAIFPLVEYAATFKSDEIPEEILKLTTDLFLDTISCIHAGSSARGIDKLCELNAFWGGNRQSTVFCFSEKTSAPAAAFLNAVMGHAHDFDDTHDGALNHGCVTLVPALLATSEALRPTAPGRRAAWIPAGNVSGLEFLAALAIGLDISNRLGMAFIPYLHVGWLPTTLWGPFACAAACGRLLGLDTEKMGHAFGLAYSQIHANRQGLVDGALSKRVQPGFSASAGLQAAFLAAGGISGADCIVDGDFGLKSLYSGGQSDATYLSDGIGTAFETANVSIKPYPCCRCTHPVIDAVLSLKSEHDIPCEEIASGTIYLPPQSMGQIGNPFAVRDNPTVDAQFSAPYTAALTFTRGWPRLGDFAPDQVVNRKTIIDLASRFSVVEFDKNNPGLVPVELEVRLKTGAVFRRRISRPKGSRNNPLTQEELAAKFADCLDHSIKPYSVTETDHMLQMINRVTELADIDELIGLFR